MDNPEKVGHRWGDTALETLVIGGFIAVQIALFFYVVPQENQQHFSQALGVMSVIVTLVAKSLWERRGQTAAVTEKAIDTAHSALPAAAVPLFLPAPEQKQVISDAVSDGTVDGIARAVDQAAPAEDAAQLAERLKRENAATEIME